MSDGITGPQEALRNCVECGSLRFTSERVEKVRRGLHITAFKRAGVRRARIFRGYIADSPERELVLAVAVAAGGALAARADEMGWACGLWTFAALFFGHLCRRTIILKFESDAGSIRVDAEVLLTNEEVAAVVEQVRRLGWPVA